MPAVTPERTVGDLVTENPNRARLFEKHGIDYCCGGKKSLAEACAASDVDVDTLLSALESLGSENGGDQRNWSDATMTELADHIEATHHDYLRSELPRLETMLKKVARVHGERHPEMKEVLRVFDRLKMELVNHMAKEEEILFPICRQLETATEPQRFHCGSVQNPIRVMEHEHDVVGNALQKMDELTSGYTPPEDACNTYRVLLDGLARLQEDLHIHIHKENNILFPKAAAAEEQIAC